MKYIFKDRPLTIRNAAKANAQTIGTELEKITVAAKGRLTPKAVVKAAEAPRNPLHRHFQWDDRLAAEGFRIEQARCLIRSVSVVLDDTEQPSPGWLSVSDKGGVSYRSASEVMSSVALQEAVLAAAERDLASFEKRYHDLDEICALVREAREKIAARRSIKQERDDRASV